MSDIVYVIKADGGKYYAGLLNNCPVLSDYADDAYIFKISDEALMIIKNHISFSIAGAEIIKRLLP